MESDLPPQISDDTTDPLRVAERAAAAPYLQYPELPRWYPLVGGAWFAAWITCGIGRWPDHTAVRLGLMAVLLAAAGGAYTWYRDKRGVEVSPDHRRAPAEIGRAMRRYYLGAAVVAVVCLAGAAFAPPALSALVTFVLVSAGLGWYEHRYRRAAVAVEQRLA